MFAYFEELYKHFGRNTKTVSYGKKIIWGGVRIFSEYFYKDKLMGIFLKLSSVLIGLPPSLTIVDINFDGTIGKITDMVIE